MKRMVCAFALATGTGVVLGSVPQHLLLQTRRPRRHPAACNFPSSRPHLFTSDASATLDINYNGGTVRSVELYVDNAKVFRKSVKFSFTHGNFNLKLDSSLLTEGDHDVMVVGC